MKQKTYTQKTIKHWNERNQRWYKQMEKYIMFLDQKNKYCEIEYSFEINL